MLEDRHIELAGILNVALIKHLHLVGSSSRTLFLVVRTNKEHLTSFSITSLLLSSRRVLAALTFITKINLIVIACHLRGRARSSLFGLLTL